MIFTLDNPIMMIGGTMQPTIYFSNDGKIYILIVIAQEYKVLAKIEYTLSFQYYLIVWKVTF